MSVHGGPADWWTQGTDAGRKHVATKGIVQNGLILNLDAGVSDSYPGTGNIWYDLSGNGNNVTLYNTISFDGVSLYGDSVNSYGRTTNTLNLSALNKITVVSLWRQISLTATGMIYEHTSNWNSNTGGFGLASNSQGGGLVTNWNHHQLRGNSSYSGTNVQTPDITKFQVYATIHDFSASSNLETVVYINGNLQSGSPYGSDNSNNFANDYLYFWSRGGTTSFNSAYISQFMIYNRVLTAQEIRQNFNATRGRYGI